MCAANSGLPERFLERLGAIVGAAHEAAVLASFAAERPFAFRINTLRAAVADVLDELREIGIVPEPLPWASYAFLAPARNRDTIVSSSAFAEGRLFVQSPSSMLAPWVLDPRPGETVLDLAAAPGGKATQIAALMENQGHLSVVEPIRSRFFKLRDVLQRHGVSVAKMYMTDGRSVGRKVPERFDRVMLDAPCSSESRFRVGHPETWAYWSERKIAEQSRKQKGLLRSALLALKPGGRLVYATCSFAPEENEAVIDDAIRRFGEAIDVVSVKMPIDNVMPGLAQWQGRTFDVRVHHAVRVLPLGAYDAFFLCRIDKRHSLQEATTK